MGKTARTVKLSPEVGTHIDNHTKLDPEFVFSHWAEEQYRNQFMKLPNIQKAIAEIDEKQELLHKEKDALLVQLQQLQDIEVRREKQLSADAIRFLKNVPELLNNGAQAKAVYRRFISTYKIPVDYVEYIKLVETHAEISMEDRVMLQ